MQVKACPAGGIAQTVTDTCLGEYLTMGWGSVGLAPDAQPAQDTSTRSSREEAVGCARLILPLGRSPTCCAQCGGSGRRGTPEAATLGLCTGVHAVSPTRRAQPTTAREVCIMCLGRKPDLKGSNETDAECQHRGHVRTLCRSWP